MTLSGNQPKGSNQHRIRQLEAEVAELRSLLFRIASGNANNPVARLVQLPERGIDARDDDEPGKATCRNVWLNSDGKLYLPGGENAGPEFKTVVHNILAKQAKPTGERLGMSLIHDDGYWWLHAFDCDDDGDGDKIKTLSTGTLNPGGP